MPDDLRFDALGGRPVGGGPRGEPPHAPLAMPTQVIERPRRLRSAWLLRLLRASR